MDPVSPAPSFEVEMYGCSDIGVQRKNNEDNFIIRDLSSGETTASPGVVKRPLGSRGTLFLVADGMGGQQAGEVASRMCVELVPQKLHELLAGAEAVETSRLAGALSSAIQHANTAIYEKAQKSQHERGMGCTATAAAALARQLVIAQVGDSRAYLLRAGQIQQLTKDQTLETYLAAFQPRRSNELTTFSHNILTQAVGAAPTVEPRITRVELASGDCLLLCSDGLYNMVADEEILRIVSATSELAGAAREMIRRANARGGPDNITIILARFATPGGDRPDTSLPIECSEIDL